MRKPWIGLLLICWLLAACGSPTVLPPSALPATVPPIPSPSPAPPTAAPTVDPFFRSQGGGEPRTAGYWLL
ncbi:MAG: hypothetical protein PVI80_13915 [Anaerolineae bacterium]